MTQALVTIPNSIRTSEVIEVKALIAHPMESGFRPDSEGKTLPRDIVSNIEANYAGSKVFEAKLFSSVAANPYVSFFLRVTESGPLQISWRGDKGFAHTETVVVKLA